MGASDSSSASKTRTPSSAKRPGVCQGCESKGAAGAPECEKGNSLQPARHATRAPFDAVLAIPLSSLAWSINGGLSTEARICGDIRQPTVHSPGRHQSLPHQLPEEPPLTPHVVHSA